MYVCRYFIAMVLLAPVPAVSAQITIESPYHFVDRLGTNSFTNAAGLYLTLGAVGVTPNSLGGTSGTYRQGSVTGTLTDVSSSIRNEFGDRVPYSPALTGSWELTFSNGTDTTVVSTPSVGAVQAPEFVTDVVQTGPALTPTFAWVPPAGIDRIQIYIRDLKNLGIGGGGADILLVQQATGNSFTVPEGLLEENGIYSIQIQGDKFGADENILARSRVFFDFSTSPLPDTGDAPIFLPQTDTTSGTPIFNFDNQVVKGALGYYDPVFAIGYDFEIGNGDPLFASVLMPDIGDGLFDLLLPNALGGFDHVAELMGGVEYSFDSGVDQFRILGIEPSAGLNPQDPTAFVTGLSFTDDGRFTGTMTPIVQKYPAVPLPATGWLLASGLAGVVSLRRRRA